MKAGHRLVVKQSDPKQQSGWKTGRQTGSQKERLGACEAVRQTDWLVFAVLTGLSKRKLT